MESKQDTTKRIETLVKVCEYIKKNEGKQLDEKELNEESYQDGGRIYQGEG